MHSTKQAKAIRIEYENVGKEPALDASFNFAFKRFDGPAIVNSSTPLLPIPKNETCMPRVAGNAPIFPIRMGANDGKLLIMSDPRLLSQFNQMESGFKTLYIEGCITYVSFSQEHHSAFCYYMKPLEVSDSPDKDATLTSEGRVSVGTKLQDIFVQCPNPSTNFAD